MALRDEWRKRAALGDADAARRLRDLYDECLGVLFSAESLKRESPMAWTPRYPPDSPERRALLAIGQQRCAGIASASDYKVATRELILEARAMRRLTQELGHPGNLTGYPPDASERARLHRAHAAALLADGSPEGIMDLAMQGSSDGTRFTAEAWTLAACELGYPCQGGNAFVRSWCVDFGELCEVAGLLDYAHYLSTPRQWRLAQRQRDEILRRLREGRVDELLLPPDGTTGGGG